MASLGKRGRYYYYTWRDENGLVRRRSTGCKDKSAAEKVFQQWERERKLGITDPYAKWRRILLSDHAEDYHQFQLAKGTSEKQADQVRSRIIRVLERANIKWVTDLSVTQLVKAIDSFRKQPQSPKRKEETYHPIGNRTKNFYAKALKQLTAWMVREGRLDRDPLVHMPIWNVNLDIRHARRALTDDEFSQLEHTAETSTKSVEGMNGEERAFLYRMARTTGLRKSELGSLTPRSFHLGPTPHLIVEAAYSKHREQDTVYLHPVIVEPIREKLESLAPDEPLFPLLAQRKTADMMQVDLASAGVPYEDDAGRFADFHSLRHTFVTKAWETGAPANVVMNLARHKNITTTLRYTHKDQQAQINALRSMAPPKRKAE